MYRISSLLFLLSLGLGVYLLKELKLLGFESSIAADQVPTASGASEEQIVALQKRLEDKTLMLEAKEIELTKRENALNGREKLLSEQVKQYEKALTEMKQRATASVESLSLPRQDKASDDLSKVYEKMEPKKAAKILDRLDVELATRILKPMKEDRAADILGRMSGDKAKDITERLSARMSSGSLVVKP